MPSNSMYVCLDCRVGGKGVYPACQRGNHRVKCFGKHITVPKKNNDRAWKRIEAGESLWNRRKVRRHGGRNFLITSVPGHKKGQRRWLSRYVPRSEGPDVDLGG